MSVPAVPESDGPTEKSTSLHPFVKIDRQQGIENLCFEMYIIGLLGLRFWASNPSEHSDNSN